MEKANAETQQNKKCTEGVPPTDVVLPKKELRTLKHQYGLKNGTNEFKGEIKKALLDEIEKEEMLPFYQALVKEYSWPEDQQLIERLSEANQKELQALHAASEDAQRNFGDVEYKDSLLAVANFYCRIGDIENAIPAYERAHDKTVGLGGRLKIIMTVIRIGLIHNLDEITSTYLKRAQKNYGVGGDWDKRNKLRVYEALYLSQQGQFKEAAELFQACIPIFDAAEILTFETFLQMTVILTMATFDRTALRSKILEDPEIQAFLARNALYHKLLHSFFYGEYANFIDALITVYDHLCEDEHLHKYAFTLVQILRVKAYEQYLHPFEYAILDQMSTAFNIPKDLLETDLVEFVANGKLKCKLNRIDGLIQCIRREPAEDVYIKYIQQGDMVFEKAQKLSKVIDL